MRIRISSRKSDLARIQAFSVGNALKTTKQCEIEYHFRESLGDKNLNDPLWQMPEKGVFTEDFLDDLIQDRTDLVVHSWKDLPIEERKDTLIAATLPRADVRDLLLFRKSKILNLQQTQKLKIFSSSPRRAYNLEGFFKEALPTRLKEVRFEPVRGNVPTRVRKLFESDLDGLIVAKAALDRLLQAQGEEFSEMKQKLLDYLKQCLVMILPLEKNPTAPAQGALAIEIKKGRVDLEEALKAIHCPRTYSAVHEERRRLESYGGGCHQKVGISIRSFDYGSVIYTRAFTDRTGAVDLMEFRPVQVIEKTTTDKIFPSEAKKEDLWFERRALRVQIPKGALFVSKADALPDSFTAPWERVVWASGWQTWKKLAQRGIWVSGCSEGLGEHENLHDFSLWKNETWTKLTHSDNPLTEPNSLATYQLIPLVNPPVFNGQTHFYWKSGTSFLRAIKLYPEIIKARHFCGPGHTYEIISNYTSATIFPTFQLWKEQVVR